MVTNSTAQWKSDAEVQATIERQAEETARVLKLPRSKVFTVSAQKARAATILGDPALRVRSGIESLEYLLAHQVIPSRRDMLYHAVSREVSALLDESRVDLAARLKRSSAELIQLSQLSGKNRGLIEQSRAALQQEKDSYDATADGSVPPARWCRRRASICCRTSRKRLSTRS